MRHPTQGRGRMPPPFPLVARLSLAALPGRVGWRAAVVILVATTGEPGRCRASAGGGSATERSAARETLRGCSPLQMVFVIRHADLPPWLLFTASMLGIRLPSGDSRSIRASGLDGSGVFGNFPLPDCHAAAALSNGNGTDWLCPDQREVPYWSLGLDRGRHWRAPAPGPSVEAHQRVRRLHTRRHLWQRKSAQW